MKDIAHEANQCIFTEMTLMSACDAIDMLAACNVHEYPDCDTPLSRATVPSTCFPLADIAPVAALVNVVQGRVVCSSTAQVSQMRRTQGCRIFMNLSSLFARSRLL